MSNTKDLLSEAMQTYLGCLYDKSLSIHDVYYGIAVKSTLQRGIEEKHFRYAIDYINELERQNAELVEALEKIAKMPSQDCNTILELNNRLDIADAALTKAGYTPMTIQRTVTIDGISLDVEFAYYAGEKATQDCQGCPEEYEVTAVRMTQMTPYLVGIDISSLLSDDTMQRIIKELEKIKGDDL